MLDGRDYIATSAVRMPRVVQDGDFRIAVAGLAHGHVYSLVGGLLEAGATLDCVYDRDPSKVESFIDRFGGRARAVSGCDTISGVGSTMFSSYRSIMAGMCVKGGIKKNPQTKLAG